MICHVLSCTISYGLADSFDIASMYDGLYVGKIHKSECIIV